MAYGTGGFTYGGVTASSSPSAIVSYFSDSGTTTGFRGYQGAVGFPTSISSLAVGWNAGGGFEWMFGQNWSLKSEAIYYNLGSQNLTSYIYAPAMAFGSGQSQIVNTIYRTGDWLMQTKNTVSFNGIIARAGVNYHFNFGALPVVAKF